MTLKNALKNIDKGDILILLILTCFCASFCVMVLHKTAEFWLWVDYICYNALAAFIVIIKKFTKEEEKK